MARPKNVSVEQFLDELSHPRRVEIEELRHVILRSSAGITEQVKWNAPSFCIDGDDRITFRLQPGDVVELVFHRGAKKVDDSDSFEFVDPTGLITWRSSDRGTVTFRDHDDLRAKTPALAELVDRWMKATAP